MRRGYSNRWDYDEAPQHTCSAQGCENVAVSTTATHGVIEHSCLVHIAVRSRNRDIRPAIQRRLREYGFIK